MTWRDSWWCCNPGSEMLPSATERILSPENFAATVYTKLGIDPAKILHTPSGRPVQLVSDPTPIRELI